MSFVSCNVMPNGFRRKATADVHQSERVPEQ